MPVGATSYAAPIASSPSVLRVRAISRTSRENFHCTYYSLVRSFVRSLHAFLFRPAAMPPGRTEGETPPGQYARRGEVVVVAAEPRNGRTSISVRSACSHSSLPAHVRSSRPKIIRIFFPPPDWTRGGVKDIREKGRAELNEPQLKLFSAHGWMINARLV